MMIMGMLVEKIKIKIRINKNKPKPQCDADLCLIFEVDVVHDGLHRPLSGFTNVFSICIYCVDIF